MGRLRWTRRRRLAALLLLIAATGLVGVNLLARVHARGMTRFVDGGSGPARPEDLTLGGKLRLLFTGIEVPRPENGSDPGDHDLAYVSERLQASDGTGLEAWRLPAEAEPAGNVLLLHGYASSKEDLLSEAGELHRLGFEVWLLDLRGSGGSDGRRTTLGWEEARDVAAAVAALPEGPLIVYGQSMGAVAALRAIHLGRITPDALILEAPFDELRTTVNARFEAMGLPTWPLAGLLLWHGGRELGVDPDAFAPWRWAGAVTCPTLHLYGGADRRVPVAASERLYGNLRGPRTARCFEGVGHVSLYSAAPGAWREAVAAFLAPFTP